MSDWSKDWANFNWISVCEKMADGEEDIGITKEELYEFFCWMQENDRKVYFKVLLYLRLREAGFSDEEALLCLENPEILLKAVQRVKESRRKEDMDGE